MTTEQLQGAKLFLDAMNADLEVNKTNQIKKIGLIMQLKKHINAKDAEKSMEVIKQYHNLSK